MGTLRNRFSYPMAVALMLLALLSAPVLARSFFHTSSPEKDSPPEGTNQTPGAQSVKMASLDASALALPRMALSAVPQTPSSAPVTAFLQAEEHRKAPRMPEAVRTFIDVIEQYPDSPQATAADTRIDYIVTGQTPEGLDAIEAALPALSEVSTVDAVTDVGLVYLLQAQRFEKSDPSRAQGYWAKLCDVGWKIFQGKLDEGHKKVILDLYLAAADSTGQGEAVRSKLSAYAASITPCFASWIIKTMVDEQEPPASFVTTHEGQASVRQYYLDAAGAASDPDVKASYYTKARDLGQQMFQAAASAKPMFDDCLIYLGAASSLGDTERLAAVAEVESVLDTQALSIQRWIARYELASFLTREGASEEEARTGYHHFETLVEEATPEVIEATINDTSIDGRTRGLIMCVLGHGYAGTNRVDEAELHYQWVLDYFPKESHPGETAAYSLAVMEDRKNCATPAVGAAIYEQFVADNPSSFYSPGALMQAAQNHLRNNDAVGAAKAYQRVATEFASRPDSKEAEKRLTELSAQSSQAN